MYYSFRLLIFFRLQSKPLKTNLIKTAWGVFILTPTVIWHENNSYYPEHPGYLYEIFSHI